MPASTIFRFTAATMLLLGGLSLALIAVGGWPSRFAPAVLQQAAGRTDISPDRKRCHDSFVRGAQPCILGAGMHPDAILWGDSHGVELAQALALKAKAQGHSLIERTTSSCPPVLGYDAPKDARCAAANRSTLNALRADPGIRRVYLAAFWANGQFDSPAFVRKLDYTITLLRREGREVTIIGPVPPQPFDVPRRLAHLARAGRLNEAQGVDRAFVDARTIHLRALFTQWRARGVRLIDPMAALCDARHCAIERYGKPLYFDSHHLSMAGARLVVDHAD